MMASLLVKHCFRVDVSIFSTKRKLTTMSTQDLPKLLATLSLMEDEVVTVKTDNKEEEVEEATVKTDNKEEVEEVAVKTDKKKRKDDSGKEVIFIPYFQSSSNSCSMEKNSIFAFDFHLASRSTKK